MFNWNPIQKENSFANWAANIADNIANSWAMPTPPATGEQPGGGGYASGGGRVRGGGGGGGGQSAADAAAEKEKAWTLGLADQQIAAIDDALRNLSGTERAGLNQINDAYNKGMSRLNRQQSDALSKYRTKRTDTKEDFAKNLEFVDNNSSNKYLSLMNLLGRAGAGRSSAAENVLPHVLAQDASKSRGELSTTYGRNMRDLRDAEDETKASYKENVADLNDQRRTQEMNLRKDIKAKAAEYHGNRASLAMNRHRAAGGDFEGAKAAVQGDINQRQAIERSLSTLLDNYRNKYNIQDVKVRDPKMANYSTKLEGVDVTDPNGTGHDTDTSQAYRARMDEERKRRAQQAGTVA